MDRHLSRKVAGFLENIKGAIRFVKEDVVGGEANNWSPGCENAAGKLRQKW